VFHRRASVNLGTVAFGSLLIGIGLVMMIARLQDPGINNLIAALKRPGAGRGQAVRRFVTRVVVPTVTPLVLGTSFVTLGLLGHAPSTLF
jgi:hypothetical protein